MIDHECQYKDTIFEIRDGVKELRERIVGNGKPEDSLCWKVQQNSEHREKADKVKGWIFFAFVMMVLSHAFHIPYEQIVPAIMKFMG